MKNSGAEGPDAGGGAAPPPKHIHIDELLSLMGHACEKPVQFEVHAPPESHVFIAGTFNNWNARSHPLAYHPEAGVFRETLLLPCGRHEYKFVIDGVWTVDTHNLERAISAEGTVNSVVVV